MKGSGIIYWERLVTAAFTARGRVCKFDPPLNPLLGGDLRSLCDLPAALDGERMADAAADYVEYATTR